MAFRRLSLAFAFIILSFGPARAQSVVGFGEFYRLEVEYRRWSPTFVSDLEVGGAGLAATPIFPAADLGLGDERGTELRGSFRLRPWLKVRSSYVPFDYVASKDLERSLAFAGMGFPEGATVETRLQIEHLKAGVEVDLWRSPDGFFGVVADYSRFEARPDLSSPAVGRAERGPLRVALPLLGLMGRIYLVPRLSLSAEATGMKRENSGVVTDFEGLVTYNLSYRLAVGVGYRNFYARVADEGDRGAFRLRGVFFSAALRL